MEIPCININEDEDVFAGLCFTDENVPPLTLPSANNVCSTLATSLTCDFGKLKERKHSTSTPLSSRTDSKLLEKTSNDSGFECALNLSEACLSLCHDESGSTRDHDLSLTRMNLTVDHTDIQHNSSHSHESDSVISLADSGIDSLLLTNSESSFSTSTHSVDLLLRTHHDSVFTKVLENFSPREPDRLIGRKMGLEHVDIITELSQRNIRCVSNILKMLSAQDLCRMCLVSRDWRSSCQNDWAANARRCQYLVQVHTGKDKENKVRTSPKKKQRHAEHTRQSRTAALSPLKVVQLTGPAPPQHNTPAMARTRHKLFVEEAKKLKNDESLRKCPRCQCPAKVHRAQERACCSNSRCGYDFCIKCRNAFHGTKECITALSKKTKTDSSSSKISSRKSQRNLRRL